MKYFTIEIKPNRDGWESSYHLDPIERVDTDSTPNGLGFYHCPESKGLYEGFVELKEYMIKRHEERIKQLQDSLVKLRNVTICK